MPDPAESPAGGSDNADAGDVPAEPEEPEVIAHSADQLEALPWCIGNSLS